MVETSSLFFSYRVAQDITKKYIYNNTKEADALPLSAMLACGAASGAFTSLLLTPIELIKCKMQVPLAPGATQKPGPVQLISSVFRHQGILGFWHGQMGTLIRETGGSAAWFGGYEIVLRYFRYQHEKNAQKSKTLAANGELADKFVDSDLPIYQRLLAGASAGISYNFIFYPADTIKSRMQTADSSSSASQTFWSTGRNLWRQQGLKGMYSGCGITCARSAPSSAFIFFIYEALREYFG